MSLSETDRQTETETEAGRQRETQTDRDRQTDRQTESYFYTLNARSPQSDHGK